MTLTIFCPFVKTIQKRKRKKKILTLAPKNEMLICAIFSLLHSLHNKPIPFCFLRHKNNYGISQRIKIIKQ